MFLLPDKIDYYKVEHKENGKDIKNMTVESQLCSIGEMTFELGPEAEKRVGCLEIVDKDI